MNINGLEIERKFLIAMPNSKYLNQFDSSEITQIYLISDADLAERVRMRKYSDKTVFTHTIKKTLSDTVRQEDESIISASDFQKYLDREDLSRRRIEKIRYCIPHGGLVFEIDIYPFWTDRAVMEVELEDTDAPFEIPEKISVYKEISSDRRYSNKELSIDVPYDDLQKG